jgi:hypothetical protein
MKHFSMQDWIDFARGIKEQELTVAMQRHLEVGCAKCMKNLGIWRHFVKFANQEGRYTPPESSVRVVKASFAVRQVMAFRAEKFELATLVFDSSQGAVAAGVRGSHASARQLLYKSGSVCVDMRMQPKPGSDSVVLMGQLLDSTAPAQGMGDVPVSLLCKGDTLSRKKTNHVGEFEFGFGVLLSVHLVFGIGESRLLVVPVPKANTELGQSVM